MKRLLIVSLLFSVNAIAQGAPPDRGEMEAKLRAACGADLASTCPGTDGREKFECLLANRTGLSESCRAFLAQAPSHGPRPPRDGQRPPGPPPTDAADSSR